MNTQHTPGPWYALAEGITDNAIGYRAIVDSDGYTVCNPSPMGEANARLIGAAPDLLAALIECERCVNELFQETGQHEYMNASDAARAAIAKATGSEA